MSRRIDFYQHVNSALYKNIPHQIRTIMFSRIRKRDVQLQRKQQYLLHHLDCTQKMPSKHPAERVQGSRGFAMGNSGYRPHASGIDLSSCAHKSMSISDPKNRILDADDHWQALTFARLMASKVRLISLTGKLS